MHSLGINEEGKSRVQPASPGSLLKVAIEIVCVMFYVAHVCMHHATCVKLLYESRNSIHCLLMITFFLFCRYTSLWLVDLMIHSAVGPRLAERLPVNCHSNTKISTGG